jgi:serine/threonine protein kinase
VVYPEVYYRTDLKIPASPHRDAFIRGLLEIDVTKRLGSANDGQGFEQDIKSHPWLASIDWELVEQKKLEPSYKPNVFSIHLVENNQC